LGAGVVVCLERGSDLHVAQWIPLPLIVSCFSEIQIGFAFLVLAHLGSPGQWAIKRVCVLHRPLPLANTEYFMLSTNCVKLTGKYAMI